MRARVLVISTRNQLYATFQCIFQCFPVFITLEIPKITFLSQEAQMFPSNDYRKINSIISDSIIILERKWISSLFKLLIQHYPNRPSLPLHVPQHPSLLSLMRATKTRKALWDITTSTNLMKTWDCLEYPTKRGRRCCGNGNRQRGKVQERL